MPQRKRAMQVQEETCEPSDSSAEESDEYTFGVGKTPTVDLKINGKTAKFFVDTGASINILDEKTAKQLLLQLEETQAKVHACNGIGLIRIRFGNKTVSLVSRERDLDHVSVM